MALSDCVLVKLPHLIDHRGGLAFVEGGRHVDFSIKRIYYLYQIPQGETRGGHAHKALRQLIIAISGSFAIILDDGREQKKTIHLSDPSVGLYVCPMIWRDLALFSEDAVCLVLASEHYDEADYYRNYAEFRRAVDRI